MAEATTLATANPKQLGKQLRAVRRRKGLSLSEVARGAGLSRRELVNYERGKVEIPESDLWVLAGSCGVDVAELVPPTEPLALNAAPASMEDTITQLRSNQPDAGLTRHLDTLYALRALPPGSSVQLQERERDAMAQALGHDPAAIEAKLMDAMHVSKDEARRLRALIVPDAPRYTPLAIEAPEPEPVAEAPAVASVSDPTFEVAFAPVPGSSAFDADVPSGPVDVFEELAKLPEPVALPDPNDDVTDFLSPPREPAGSLNGTDDPMRDAFAAWPAFRSALPEPTVEPTSDPILVDMQAATDPVAANTYGAEHAPPIDVVERAGGFGAQATDADTLPTRAPSSWEPPIWDATWTSDATTTTSTGPTDIVEFVDEYVAESTDGTTTIESDSDESPIWGTWNRAQYVDEAVDVDEVVPDTASVPSSGTGPWDHAPDPAATSSGFYVDWGTEPTEDPAPEAIGEDAFDTESPETDAFAATSFETTTFETTTFETTTFETNTFETNTFESTAFDTESSTSPWEIAAPDTDTPTDLLTGAPDDADTPTWDDSPTWDDEPTAGDTPVWDDTPDDAPSVISWRPLADTVLAAVAVELATVSQHHTTDTAVPASFEPEPEPVEPEPVEEFVIAGPEWDLGNAVPLVEVRGQGGLVMRRADERWALADVTTTPSFAVEVDVDFRSGPGFGVLFRASTDASGHMSGYSFDVDPIHEGGSYLVRQWYADRELWNPIARVAAPDPAAMHGLLAIRVVVLGDRLTASVNGSTVLSVDSLDAACAERNREPATGDRVGIQAWSSSDLVIETLRVAAR